MRLPFCSSHSSEPSCWKEKIFVWNIKPVSFRNKILRNLTQQSQMPSFIRLLGTEWSRPRPVKCLCLCEIRWENNGTFVECWTIKMMKNIVEIERTVYDVSWNNKKHHSHMHSFPVHHFRPLRNHSNHRSVFPMVLPYPTAGKRRYSAALDYTNHNLSSVCRCVKYQTFGNAIEVTKL